MASARRHEGKVAVVTGSTEGIGFAIAERLGLEGAKVVISSRKPEKVATAVNSLKAKGIEAVGIPCHVGSKEDSERLVSETVRLFGRIDIFVANAAVSPHFGPTMETSESAFDKLIAINLRAPFFMAKMVVPHMPRGSSIIFVSSFGAFFAEPSIGIYSVTKTALLGLTKVLARELASEGIRVNSICPGVIKTKFSSALWESKEAEQASTSASGCFMFRAGESDECSGSVAFLASSDASYITGENLVIAGGIAGRL